MALCGFGDRSLYYEVQGKGEPLVLIMGLGCSLRQWQWLVPLLTGQFRVISLDNRCVGRSDKPADEFTTADMAADVIAIMDHLDIARAHIVGASVGGMVAQQFALDYPERVLGLVLACTMPSFSHLPPAGETISIMASSVDEETGFEQGAIAMSGLFLSEQFQRESMEPTGKMIDLISSEREEQGSAAFLLQLAAAMDHDTVDRISEIHSPTLVLSGDQDPIAPVANAHFFAEAISGSQLLILQGVRHGWWLEQVDVAAKGIIEFLSTCQNQKSGTVSKSTVSASTKIDWEPDALQMMKKVPFFVRSLAKRTSEKEARSRGMATVTAELVSELQAKHQK